MNVMLSRVLKWSYRGIVNALDPAASPKANSYLLFLNAWNYNTNRSKM